MSPGNGPAPRICSFMVNGRMTLVRADQVVRLDDLGDGKTAMLLVGSNSSFPILVDGDLSEVARKIWGDAWSAGAASEGTRESEELVHDAVRRIAQGGAS